MAYTSWKEERATLKKQVGEQAQRIDELVYLVHQRTEEKATLEKKVAQLEKRVAELEATHRQQQHEIEALRNQADYWKRAFRTLEKHQEQLHRENILLKEKVKSLQYTLYGKKTEKPTEPIEDAGMIPLFDENEGDAIEFKETRETITYTRRKPRRGRGKKLDLSNLQRCRIIYDLLKAGCYCPECKEALTKIAEQIVEQVEVIPQQFFIIEHVTLTYACKKCDFIASTEKEKTAIEKCEVGNSVLAQVLINKYAYHLPIYRQSKIYERQGFVVPDSTIGRWTMQLASAWERLSEALWEELNSFRYLQVDETPVTCLESKKKAYMWVFLGFAEGKRRCVIFDFHLSREQSVVDTRLANYQGLLQTDGYGGYNNMRKKEGVITLGCGAHIRRRFRKALRLSGGLGDYHRVQVIEEGEQTPTEVDKNTLVIYKKLPIVTVYWNEQGSTLQKSLLEEEVTDILEQLTRVGKISEDKKLIEKITLRFCCARLGKAAEAVEYFRQLYKIEKEARVNKLSAAERLALRQKEAKPILEKFYQWLIETQPTCLPKGQLGQAIAYALAEWPYWSQYVDYGEAEIDDNYVENIIRPFAIGRKNWLFVGHALGGQASALFYSLIQNCLINAIEPWNYIYYLLHHTHQLRRGEVQARDLLPHRMDSRTINAFAQEKINKLTRLFQGMPEGP